MWSLHVRRFPRIICNFILETFITLPLKTPWNQNPNVQSRYIFDMHRSHLVATTRDNIKNESKIAIIPAGFTSKLKPLDLTVNHFFKSKLCNKFENWVINEYKNIKV